VVFCTCVSCLIKWDLCLLFSGQMALHSSEVISWLGLHLGSDFLRGKYGPSNTLPSVWVYTNHSWIVVNLNIPWVLLIFLWLLTTAEIFISVVWFVMALMHENLMLNLNDETVMKFHRGQWAMAVCKWGYLEFFLLVLYMNKYRNNKNLLFIKIYILILCHRVWSHVHFQNKYVLWELLIDIALSLFLTPLHFYCRVSEIASGTSAAWYICIIGAHPLCI